MELYRKIKAKLALVEERITALEAKADKKITTSKTLLNIDNSLKLNASTKDEKNNKN